MLTNISTLSLYSWRRHLLWWTLRETLIWVTGAQPLWRSVRWERSCSPGRSKGLKDEPESLLAASQATSSFRRCWSRLTAAEREGCLCPPHPYPPLLCLCLHIITPWLTDMVLKVTKQRGAGKQRLSYSLRWRGLGEASAKHIFDFYSNSLVETPKKLCPYKAERWQPGALGLNSTHQYKPENVTATKLQSHANSRRPAVWMLHNYIIKLKEKVYSRVRLQHSLFFF